MGRSADYLNMAITGKTWSGRILGRNVFTVSYLLSNLVSQA